MLNRPIDVLFSAEVDFDSVSQNTIHIASSSGLAAMGSFSLLADGSDAGLKKGGVAYELNVLGSLSGGITVRSTEGAALHTARSVHFRTPDTEDEGALYLDMVPGPHARARGGLVQRARRWSSAAGDLSSWRRGWSRQEQSGWSASRRPSTALGLRCDPAQLLPHAC